MASGDPQEGNPIASGQPVLVLSHTHSIEVFLVLRGTSCAPACAHCLLSCPLPGSVFSAPSLQVFKYTDEIPLSLLSSALLTPFSLSVGIETTTWAPMPLTTASRAHTWDVGSLHNILDPAQQAASPPA